MGAPATTSDDARALRVKLDLARSLLGDALDGVRRAGDMLEEIAAVIEERGGPPPEQHQEAMEAWNEHDAQSRAPGAAEEPSCHNCGDLESEHHEGARCQVALCDCRAFQAPPSGTPHTIEASPMTAAPAPKAERTPRPEKPIPANWAPKSATRIRLAALGIDAGPNSTTLAAYRATMAGQVRKTWTDKDFEAWAKAQQRQRQPEAQQSLLGGTV